MHLKSRQFLSLQATWYKKLYDTGFKDAEQSDGNLKVWASYFSIRYKGSRFEAKEQYYIMAGQFLHEYPFESEQDRVIWEMHSNGISNPEIAKSLSTPEKKRTKNYAGDIVRRLRKEMMTKCLIKTT